MNDSVHPDTEEAVAPTHADSVEESAVEADDAIEGRASAKGEELLPVDSPSSGSASPTPLPAAPSSTAREVSSAATKRRRPSPLAKATSVLEETALAPARAPQRTKSPPPPPRANPISSSARPSISPSIRIRKTPRPKKKLMSVLDYVKDEGGFD